MVSVFVRRLKKAPAHRRRLGFNSFGLQDDFKMSGCVHNVVVFLSTKILHLDISSPA